MIWGKFYEVLLPAFFALSLLESETVRNDNIGKEKKSSPGRLQIFSPKTVLLVVHFSKFFQSSIEIHCPIKWPYHFFGFKTEKTNVSKNSLSQYNRKHARVELSVIFKDRPHWQKDKWRINQHGMNLDLFVGHVQMWRFRKTSLANLSS